CALHGDNRCPSGDECLGAKCEIQDPQKVQKPRTAEKAAGRDADPQRECREGRNACPCKTKHLGKWIFGLACGAGTASKGKNGLLHSQPRNHAAHIAVFLPKRADGIDRAMAEEPKISNVLSELIFGNPCECPIKQRRCPTFEPGLRFAG